jgi:arylsulfate sulfotransferase
VTLLESHDKKGWLEAGMSKDNLPPHRIEKCISERREPGMMVFNVRPGGGAELTSGEGWIIGIDQAGKFPLNLKFDTPAQDSCALPNGNLLFSLTGAGIIREVARSGEPVRQWHVAGKWQDQIPPPGSIEIDIPLSHHRVNIFPDGNLLLMTAEVREFPDWPASDDDPNATRRTARLVGDIILEVSPGGDVVNRWAMLDLLDPYRLCYGSCSGYWGSRGFPDSNDWCHANAVTLDASDNSILVSLRNQDCIVKFSRETGELKWILGDHGNWQTPWSKKLLKPEGHLAWQYHQHDCSVTPTGTILCFDNGNHRATPFETKMAEEESYSRIVEFAVDEAAMTVRQVWYYGEAMGERLYSCYQGGAYRLPRTGNTFITYGGVCTIDGVPSSNNRGGFCRARLIELTPEKEIVFDMWIDGSAEKTPVSLSSFRSELVPA